MGKNLSDAEQWRPILGFQAYEVSDHGRVRSTACSRYGLRVRKLTRTKNGYLRVDLPDAVGKVSSLSVHRLVLLAFIGPPPITTMHGCHFDGDRENNYLANLRWATARENAIDKIRHGTILLGEQTNRARLTAGQVRMIREAHANRAGRVWGCARLAAEFGVNYSSIQDVVRGRSWLHVR